MEVRVEKETFLAAEEQLERCRTCGKLFKPYTVVVFGQESDSSICRECREKYS